MFKEPNALPIPPDATVPVGDLRPDEIEAKIDALLRERDNVARQVEDLEQRIRYLMRYVCGKDDTVDVEDYTKINNVPVALVAAVQPSIGQLRWHDDLEDLFKPQNNDDAGNVSGVKWGSGALVASNLFLTAGHCFDQKGGKWIRPSRNYQLISRSEIATLMDVVFNFQFVGGTGATQRRTEVRFPVVKLIEHCSHERTVGGIDYALVELGRDASNRLPGDVFDFLKAATIDVKTPGDELFIIQHPNGREKRVGVGSFLQVDCGLMAYNDIDTGEGSSGAPVVDLNGEIVGVHVHGGCLPKGGRNHAQRIGDIRLVSKNLP